MIWKWNYFICETIKFKNTNMWFQFIVLISSKNISSRNYFWFSSIYFHVSMEIYLTTNDFCFSDTIILFNVCWRLIFIFQCKFNFSFWFNVIFVLILLNNEISNNSNPIWLKMLIQQNIVKFDIKCSANFQTDWIKKYISSTVMTMKFQNSTESYLKTF